MSMYKIGSHDVNGDGSLFNLLCAKDGLIVMVSDDYHCFEDLMIDLHNFFTKVVETYYPDTRFDTLEVELHHYF